MDAITYHFESASQFFAELEDQLDGSGGFHDSPVSQASDYVSLLVHFQDEFLDDGGQDLAHCCYRLFDSDVFQHNMEAIVWAIIDRAIQNPSEQDMWITYHILLYAGKEFPKVYHWMLKSEFLAKLKYQIWQLEGNRLQAMAVCLMYEVCRVQTLKQSDLAMVDEPMLNYLLDLVEGTRTDADENLNYAIIKLLLTFNEQYMLNKAAMLRAQYTQGGGAANGKPLAYDGNLLLQVLCHRQGACCTFGENLIFILNRAEDTTLQMLILKLLYLVFTNPKLYDFFYTNDLHVLVDVMIRELWDLPEEEESLRHAYLRVLGPVLTNTQLSRASYKRAELIRVLRELAGGGLDITLRNQLHEQQLQEQLREQKKRDASRMTFRDRESSNGGTLTPQPPSSSSQQQRWGGDRSACSSPILVADVEKKKKMQSSSRLQHCTATGTDSSTCIGTENGNGNHHLCVPLPVSATTAPFFNNNESLNISDQEYIRPPSRHSSPTTQRLVERVLREWLDKEMANGRGTIGNGLAVRDVTDKEMIPLTGAMQSTSISVSSSSSPPTSSNSTAAAATNPSGSFSSTTSTTISSTGRGTLVSTNSDASTTTLYSTSSANSSPTKSSHHHHPHHHQELLFDPFSANPNIKVDVVQ